MFSSTNAPAVTNSPTLVQPPTPINCPNANSAPNSPPDLKYTIEQIELLRRLKNSGLTKNQIVQGLDSMEKIDSTGFSTGVEANSPPGKEIKQELSPNSKGNLLPGTIGQLGSLNSATTGAEYLRSLALQHAFFNAMTNGNFVNGNAHMQQNGIQSSLAQRNLAAALMCSQGMTIPGIGGLHNQAASPASAGLAGSLVGFHLGSTNAAENSILNQMSHINGGGGANSPVNLKRESMGGVNASLGDPTTISDDDEQLMQLQSMSVVDTKEEIKNFMMCHGIKQHQVAEKTGVSQSYISQFLHQGVWMKDSTRTNIYKWYLDEKRKREASGDMVSPVHSNSSRGNSPINEGSNISQTPPTSNTITGQQINNNNNNNNSPVGTNSSKNGASDGGSNGYSAVGQPIQQVKKRDRFVWKESCVCLLEKFYHVNPYPDDAKREEIAQACNQLIDSTGQGHDEKLVTAVKVYNWFANRRKEIKRKNHFAEQQQAAAATNHNNLSLLATGHPAGVLPFLLEGSNNKQQQPHPHSLPGLNKNNPGGHLNPQVGTNPTAVVASAASFLDELIEHNRSALQHNQQQMQIKNENKADEYGGEDKAFNMCQNGNDVDEIDEPVAKKPKSSLAEQLAEVNSVISELVPGNLENSTNDENDGLRNSYAMTETHSTHGETETGQQATFDVLNLTSENSSKI
ncbi:homeobox protein 2-like isoform X2 [Symsagittifera roscoffensis]